MLGWSTQTGGGRTGLVIVLHYIPPVTHSHLSMVQVFFHDQAILAIVIVAFPDIDRAIAFLFIHRDGSLIGHTHGQLHPRELCALFTGAQQGPAETAPLVAWIDANGRDPAGIFGGT